MLTNTPIMSVSQLNRHVKSYLEHEIGVVQVEGELSNLSKPSSGHMYFTLKDSSAQIRCVFFKNRHFGINVKTLTDGQKVVASGKLSLYEARGDYQLIVEQLTEAGLGELYQRFEELKNKLATEGLFDPIRKKSIPNFPKNIGIITSTTGAALQDILSTLARRYPLAPVYIYPSEVQGASASLQLIKALKAAQADLRCDVLILARGGGSIEDLWAFNDEQLARQIAASNIPIVSGVGHETDFTIADFVADYRAETPTAAATAVTPDAYELLNVINYMIMRLSTMINKLMSHKQLRLQHLIEKISSPEQAIATHWQTLDYLEKQLQTNLAQLLMNKKYRLQLSTTQLQANNPKVQVQQNQVMLSRIINQLNQSILLKISNLKHRLKANFSTLHAVSPLATLDRGYAIATHKQKIVFSSQQVNKGDSIQVRLAQGSLICDVTETHGSNLG